jgi:uncharacterized PurR-regulated membrane protein YhhQ (DUF165 family)
VSRLSQTKKEEQLVSHRTPVSRERNHPSFRVVRSRTLGVIAAAAFIATVWVSNLLVQKFGIVGVGFGLQAPAAVFVVGAAFTLRDLVHRSLGRGAVVAAIIIGAALSYLVAPAFALASGVAFVVSELADLAVYTPLAKRSWTGAVALSNTVGAAIDSYLFLAIAFGSQAFFWGQLLGKTWITAATVVLLLVGRVVVRQVRPIPAG